MTDLTDLLAAPAVGITTLTARVIKVTGRTLTVDLGGTAAGVDIPCVDSCNPQPNQYVLIQSNGTSMMALGAIGGQYRQATVTVTADATNAVTGMLNGRTATITKMGAFTPTVGAVLPLIWSADGSGVWAGATPGAAYVPPAAGDGGTSSGGGTISTGTATYPATYAGVYSSAYGWASGDPSITTSLSTGGFFYGTSRFRELQGRTITGFRANIVRKGGSAAMSIYGNPQGSPSGAPSLGYSAGSSSASGWITLPIGLANYLIGGSGTGGLAITAVGVALRGLPYGTLQFDWRR